MVMCPMLTAFAFLDSQSEEKNEARSMLRRMMIVNIVVADIVFFDISRNSRIRIANEVETWYSRITD